MFRCLRLCMHTHVTYMTNGFAKSRLCHEEHKKYCKVRKISHKACTISKGNWSSCLKVISLKVMPPETNVL